MVNNAIIVKKAFVLLPMLKRFLSVEFQCPRQL
jgi:hypothetical protein